jgi:PKD repeat protein
MNDWLRRNARWLGAALFVVLAGGTIYVLRDGDAAHAQAGSRGIAQVRAIAPALAPATQRNSRSLAATSRGRRNTTAARQSGVRPGVPSSPPSRRGLSQALRQATGLSPAQVTSRPVCPRPSAGHAACAAQALVLRTSGALVRPHVTRYRSLGRVKPALASGVKPASTVASVSPPQPDTPAYLQQAYDLSYLSQSAGTGDTVAVVDAYDDPTAASDLGTYRSFYGLPACPTSNGCFRKVAQSGSGPLPRADPTWEQEISLDLDAVSAICPQCHILLVEANSTSYADLQAAMQTAVSKGANQISASWWGVSSSVPSALSTFSGVATVAANGDGGYVGPGMDNYPAALPGVTAAGGTSLGPPETPSARGFGESAWSWNGANGGGSGCDLSFPRPAYQPAAGCAGRAYADLSADADPSTGLTVYDHGTWSLIGGTSLAAPLIAAYYAITGVAAANPQWAYGNSGTLNDVISGSSGTCAASIAYICNAGAGYDGPTGVGSISGSVAVGGPGIGGPSVGSGSAPTYTASVSAHGATITGGIYRNRLDTKWWIEYGTTTAYGQQTPASDIGSGSAPVAVSGSLSGLTAGTAYHYRLVAQNSLGSAYGYDYTFMTQPAPAGGPTASFVVSPDKPSPGVSATFDASASTAGTIGSISDYSWNFGDGTGVQDANGSSTFSHTYASRGTYTVTLTVTSNGQTDTSTRTVTVDDSEATFTPSSIAVPAGTAIAFNAGGSTTGPGGSITDYSWNFGDGSSVVDAGTNAMQTHTFPNPGNYSVTLTTTDDLAVTSTATAQITVAAFTASSGPAYSMTFAALNPPAGSTYVWNFGDGTANGTANPATHSYDKRGAYTVSVTVQNGGNTSSNTATVIVDNAPTAQFTPTPAAILPGASVGFDASASTADMGGSITDYSWDFGDGTPTRDTAGAAATSHTFTAPGIYTVTLTTTDDLGTTASASHQVTVDKPSAAFAFSPSSPAPNAPVSFDASDTSDPGSSINDYSWNFGDGTSADSGLTPSVSHTFTTAGTYPVTLTVTDQLGLTNSTTEQVVIAPAPVESTGTTTPPVEPPVVPPVSSPVPAPPAPPPAAGSPPPSVLVVKLTGAGRQRLAAATGRGLLLGLQVNQPSRVNFQITIPIAQTRQGTAGKRNPKPTVVLLRRAQALAPGKHTIALKLSRAAARRLATHGRLVLTVRITLAGIGGTQTRTLKITLTR